MDCSEEVVVWDVTVPLDAPTESWLGRFVSFR
jgi:hypothetical protein